MQSFCGIITPHLCFVIPKNNQFSAKFKIFVLFSTKNTGTHEKSESRIFIRLFFYSAFFIFIIPLPLLHLFLLYAILILNRISKIRYERLFCPVGNRESGENPEQPSLLYMSLCSQVRIPPYFSALSLGRGRSTADLQLRLYLYAFLAYPYGLCLLC